MIRLFRFFLALAPLLTLHAAEGAKRRFAGDAPTTEGALLRYLAIEVNPKTKIVLMEDFVAHYPAHISTTWVLSELQDSYARAGNREKAIAAGEKILVADPNDIAIAHRNLELAEAAKDPESVRKWAIVASDIARRLMSSPKPAGAEEVVLWQSSIDFSKQVEATCEYTLYTLAAQAQTPEQRIALMDLLATRSPQSPYNAVLRSQLFVAWQQAGNHARALQMAEADYRSGVNNDDMLLYAATKAYEKSDTAKVAAYAKRLVETLPTKPTPNGMSEAEWTRNKQVKLGIARWMLGVIASKEQRWPDADLHLRAALPFVGQNKDIHAETLYHLGLANFKLGEAKSDTRRLADAVRFNQLCGAIPGTFQIQAKQNAASIRSQFHLQ
jgi:tetratricopeptide (TPR) repeat protein